MTEQQIKHLKSVLCESKLAENSPELDQKVLQAAKQHAALLQQKKSSRSVWFGSSALQSALSVLLIAICLFTGMSYWVSGPQEDEPMGKLVHDSNVNFEIELATSSGKADPLVRPERIEVAERPAFSKEKSDQILLDTVLPEPAELIASLDFNIGVDHAQMTQNIGLALSDINGMIRMGELDGARERYAQLRESCVDCGLPDSLELLVLNSRQLNSGSG